VLFPEAAGPARTYDMSSSHHSGCNLHHARGRRSTLTSVPNTQANRRCHHDEADVMQLQSRSLHLLYMTYILGKWPYALAGG
jgi:hypothetical protein